MFEYLHTDCIYPNRHPQSDVKQCGGRVCRYVDRWEIVFVWSISRKTFSKSAVQCWKWKHATVTHSDQHLSQHLLISGSPQTVNWREMWLSFMLKCSCLFSHLWTRDENINQFSCRVQSPFCYEGFCVCFSWNVWSAECNVWAAWSDKEHSRPPGGTGHISLKAR